MKIERVLKRYSRKITHNFHSWEFSTELAAVVEDGENPDSVANALFDKAKELVDGDISYVNEYDIKPGAKTTAKTEETNVE
jgi:hypothetical protein